jgi:hypothetical protein
MVLKTLETTGPMHGYDIVAARSNAPNAIWFSTEPMSGRH